MNYSQQPHNAVVRNVMASGFISFHLKNKGGKDALSV